MCQKQKMRGFTLLETLVVLGILVVLLGIGIPAVFTIQTNLEMKDLDDTARQIFLVVQNRLTTMKATGELVTFQKELERELGSQRLENTADCPQDYGSEDGNWKSLFYVNADQAISKKYLLTGSDVLTGVLGNGSFMIELNPFSGDVYSVTYIEEGSLTREQLMSLVDRTKDSRKKTTPRLGYYGGYIDTSAVAEAPDKFEPTLELINDEDLYVTLECGGLRNIIANQRSLMITITVMDEEFNPAQPMAHLWQKSFMGGGANFIIDATGNMKLSMTLDSMRKGESFSELTSNLLNAGDNLKIVATMSYVKNDILIEGEAKAEGNSLFESRGPSLTKPNTTEIQLNHLRHLNNLNSTIYEHKWTQALDIVQTSEINFDQTKWKAGAMTPARSLPNIPYFAPIDNRGLFSSHAYPVSYDGKGNQLRNFVFGNSVKSRVGLFSELYKCSVTGVRLADSKVKGNYSDVGLLTAQAVDCTITDTWAFINTLDADGRFAIDDAFVKDHTIDVSGKIVGALVGSAVNTNMDYCIGAVPVIGDGQVGGLVGDMRGGVITNSYASGDVVAKSAEGGGLVGVVSSQVGEATVATVTGCYSSGNVTTPKSGGGMVGRTMAKVVFKNCTSYGEVKAAVGSWDLDKSGPFLGNQSVSNTYTNCKYFAQGDYNDKYTISKNYGVATGFIALCTTKPNAAESSFPYVKKLIDSSFPFPLIKKADGVETVPHYGNWPLELRLQTSLVYYEKYGDNDYGYYAVTSLTTKQDDSAGTGGGDADNTNKWEVNTLRDAVCIEDGYALMSIYDLGRFNYRLENGAEVSVQVVDSPDKSDGSKSVKMASNMSLIFTKGEMSYRISNAHVYQLPFDLQVVNRVTPASFYTKLKVNGYTKENKIVINDLTFFYCPDFAKNAVNPDPDAKMVSYPPDPNGAEKPVYVRSARQLNGLGRSYYYWSTRNSSAEKSFYFKQETEIDFAKYTKVYCGKTYNLMDTKLTNPYRNKPIGRPGNQAGAQFTCTYDGGSKRIIDFCMETYPVDFSENGVQRGFQYTGMFGEIRYATLKNIVMVASNPGDSNEASSAYVKSNYVPGSNPGIGALVGLVYVSGEDETQRARILNCVVSGYDVAYTVTKEPDIYFSGRGYGVVGGMVGFNYGTMENCVATMKTVKFNQTGGADTALTRCIGGLVGSMNDNAIVKDSYTSGLLIGSAGSGKLVYGGIAGGHQIQSDERPLSRRIVNSYSTCQWDKAAQVNGTGYYAISPATDFISMINCYYLTDAVGTDVKITPVAGVTGKSFGELSVIKMTGFGVADAKHTFTWPDSDNNPYPFPATLKAADNRYVHYGNWLRANRIYPAAMVTYYEQYQMQDTGDIVWNYTYMKPDGTPVSNLLKNQGKVLSSGYGILVADASMPLPVISGTGISNLGFAATPAGAENIGTAYGVYALRPFDAKTVQAISTNVATGVKLSMPYQVIDENAKSTTNSVLEFYMNVKYAQSLSTQQNMGTPSNPLRLRTLSQLQKMTQGQVTMGTNFTITESIWADGLTASLKNDNFRLEGGYVSGGERITMDGYGTVGSNGCYVFGLKVPLFDQISSRSTVQNLALLGVNIKNSGNQAAITLANSGIITNCIVQGNVESTGVAGAVKAEGQAAGIVVSNSGTILKSYFNGNVTAPLQASPLAISNAGWGLIGDCYTGGTVQAEQAAGFVYNNTGSIHNSYSLSRLTAEGLAQQYGFSGTTKQVANCFWAQNFGEQQWNHTISPTQGKDSASIKSLLQLSQQSMGGAWDRGDVVQSYPISAACSGKPYVYDKLAGLDHYGDWPIPLRVSTGAPLAGLGYFKSDITVYGAWLVDDGLNVTYTNFNNPTFSEATAVMMAFLPKAPSKYELKAQYASGIVDLTAIDFEVYPPVSKYKSYLLVDKGNPISTKILALYVKDLETKQEVKLNFNGTTVTAEWVE